MAGRPREFDREEALQRAMLVFWERGYNATSLKDLLACMGISRQSLYNAFGDKRRLYLEALDRYRDRLGQGLWGELTDPDASLPEIEAVFGRVHQLAVPGGPKACMIASSCMEQGLTDAGVSERARQALAALEVHLERAIENAKSKGQVPATVRPRPTARHLINTLQGIGVLLRGGADAEHVSEVIDVALSVLR